METAACLKYNLSQTSTGCLKWTVELKFNIHVWKYWYMLLCFNHVSVPALPWRDSVHIDDLRYMFWLFFFALTSSIQLILLEGIIKCARGKNFQWIWIAVFHRISVMYEPQIKYRRIRKLYFIIWNHQKYRFKYFHWYYYMKQYRYYKLNQRDKAKSAALEQSF